MKSLVRWAFDVLAALSWLLFVVNGVWWVWSYRRTSSPLWENSDPTVSVSLWAVSGNYSWIRDAGADIALFGPATKTHRSFFGAHYSRNEWTKSVACSEVSVSAARLALWTGLLPAAWTIGRAIKPCRCRRGLCPRCGYDLRATPDRCPECGTAASLGAAPSRTETT